MPNLSYVYMPVYGVEPYADNGGLGGAVVTQDNLVVTAWQVTDKGLPPPDYVSFGQLLKPAAVNTNPILQQVDRVGGSQAFESRHSGLVYINGDIGGAVDPVTIMAFVLNPPPELKQLLQGAVTYNGGNPLLLSSFNANKSLQGAYAWRPQVYGTAVHNAVSIVGGGAAFSSYLFYSDLPGDSANLRIPFLKTNGANGVAPVFFDASTANGVKQMIEAVNDGDFFICYVMVVDTDPAGGNASYNGVVYPHSAARG